MQEVRVISLDKLHLWTENPRDPVDSSLSDAEIVLRAIQDDSNNWHLDKLLSEFGGQYYYNELPTVVGVGDEFVVYDGNRRVAMLKCIQSPELFSIATGQFPLFDPAEALLNQTDLPCNVCDLDTALDIVERLHKGSGRWGKLQYEWFLNIHRGKPKGPLVLVDEVVPGLVSKNPKMNEEYVEQRLLTPANLADIGFSIEGGELRTVHDPQTARGILRDIAKLRDKGLTSARENPGKLKDALIDLDAEKYGDILPFDLDKATVLPAASEEEQHEDFSKGDAYNVKRKPTRPKKAKQLFGGPLRPCGVMSNEVYRAIEDVYTLYRTNPEKRARLLPIIGFSLRLLLDVVAREYYQAMEPGLAIPDDAYKRFLREVVKPDYKKQSELVLLNNVSLMGEWLDGNAQFESLLGKWAHGSLSASHDEIIRCSIIAGEIIRRFWQDE